LSKGASTGLLYTSTLQGSTGYGAAYYVCQLGGGIHKENDKLKVGHVLDLIGCYFSKRRKKV
jgi:hypothetical protein